MSLPLQRAPAWAVLSVAAAACSCTGQCGDASPQGCRRCPSQCRWRSCKSRVGGTSGASGSAVWVEVMGRRCWSSKGWRGCRSRRGWEEEKVEVGLKNDPTVVDTCRNSGSWGSKDMSEDG